MDTGKLRRAFQDAQGALQSGKTPPHGEFETASRYIAQHLDERQEIVRSLDDGGSFDVWACYSSLWTTLAVVFDPTSTDGRVEYIPVATALAKLERNLLAGIWDNQEAAMSHEPAIRKVIFNVTTFSRIEDSTYTELQQVLAQLLCNLVSPSGEAAETTADTNLALYLSGERDADVVIRLLDSRDPRTNTATLHLLNNLTLDPKRLASLLCPTGVRWLSQLLGRMEEFHEAEDGRFELGVAIFNRMIDSGLQGQLYSVLGAPEEAVTPSQVVLLKLVDASLANSAASTSIPSPNYFLLPAWHRLADYATASMKLGKDDARLPSILAGLVLATEALSAITIAVQGRAEEAKRSNTPVDGGGDEVMVEEMKGGDSVIEPLVKVLAAANDFMPRIKPAQPKPEASITPIGDDGQIQDGPDVELEFLKVKRDLVRLLGVLAYNDTAVGDAVRAAGGVQLVLSLCETDERNPYLREHALFAVRNLMKNNPENQAVIAQMEPLGVVGDDGELKPLPDHLKKSHAAAASTTL